MTQILCGVCGEGIMVATDSMATTFDEEGNEHHFSLDKLFPVASHAFIVSGGMGVSVELSKRFKLYAEERRLVGVEELIAAAGPYISDQYRETLRAGSPRTVKDSQLDRIYFVVGGYSFRSQDKPYQLALWGSEAGQLPLQRIKIGPSVAVPRTMAGEMKLFQMCKGDCLLAELIEFAESFLKNQAETNPQIGPPFKFGTVTSEGFKRFEKSNVPSEAE
jgi:hypothetical protein